MDTLFSNITAVTMIDKLPVILGAYVGVTDGKISYISKEPPKEQATRVIDGRGMVLMPGLINCHAHLPMTPLRGYGDDHDLQDWLSNSIFPKEDLWDSRAIRAATLLGLAECLRFGTTSVSDMYYFSDDMRGGYGHQGQYLPFHHRIRRGLLLRYPRPLAGGGGSDREVARL